MYLLLLKKSVVWVLSCKVFQFQFLAMDHVQAKERFSEVESKTDTLYICKCLCPVSSTENIDVSDHKKRILSTVERTENYLRERRILELVRFLLSKVLGQESDKPVLYLEKLLDDCMLFRAGVGSPPVLFERR